LADVLAAADLPLQDDVHGDPRWRAQLVRVLAEQVRGQLADPS
jgi:hypothetical protein